MKRSAGEIEERKISQRARLEPPEEVQKPPEFDDEEPEKKKTKTVKRETADAATNSDSSSSSDERAFARQLLEGSDNRKSMSINLPQQGGLEEDVDQKEEEEPVASSTAGGAGATATSAATFNIDSALTNDDANLNAARPKDDDLSRQVPIKRAAQPKDDGRGASGSFVASSSGSKLDGTVSVFSSSNAAAAPTTGTNVAAAAKIANSPYPKPKNFAERMMNALRVGIAADALWWVGNGKAIALSPKILRTAPELTSYFKAKDYSGFIRNCNRWGFRRVTNYEVPAGIVTYENSLFQKDQPHLVKHMRMDSDVQDVFAKHQQTGETGQAEGIFAGSKFGKGGSRKGKGRPPSATDSDQASIGSGGGGTSSKVAAAAAAMGVTLGQQDSSSWLQQQNPAAAATAGGDPSVGKELLLRRILHLTEDFLSHPGTLFRGDESIGTTMQLVRALGQQHHQELAESGHLMAILRLEASFHQKPSPANISTTTTMPPPMANALAPGQGPYGSLQGMQGSLQGMQDLSRGLLARPNASAQVDPLLGAMFLQNRQDSWSMQQQQQQELQGGQFHSSGMVDRLLAQHIQQQQQVPVLLSTTAAGVEPPDQPETGEPTGGAAAEDQPMRSDDVQDDSEEEENSGPQFTTAQELMQRLMGQQGGGSQQQQSRERR